MKNEKRLLDNLTLIQKRVYGLYNVVVADEMITGDYLEKLEEQIASCKSFDEINLLRTRICAIKDYKRQRDEEMLEIAGLSEVNELIKNENGDINYAFYAFVKELAEQTYAEQNAPKER